MISAAPEPTLIFPDNGPETGGTRVTITGENLGENDADLVGITLVQAPCHSMQWLNSSYVSCTSGNKTEGGKGVVVVETRSGGRSTADLKFTYNFQPHIVAFSPLSGPIAGGTVVNITGRHFGEAKDDVVRVELAGVPCASFTWHDGKSITCETSEHPDGAAAEGPIVIETYNGGNGTSDAPFRYNPTPLTTTIVPGSAPLTEQTKITIYGYNLGQSRDDIHSITVAGHSCRNVTWSDSEEVSCHVGPIDAECIAAPSRAPCVRMFGSVIVNTLSGGRGDQYHNRPKSVYNANFTFNPPPSIDNVEPRFALTNVNQRVTINGRHLPEDRHDILSVSFAGHECVDVNVISSDWLVCDIPPVEMPKTGLVQVTTRSGGKSRGDVRFVFKPKCDLYFDPDSCREHACAWCAATTVCVQRSDSCPARCLLQEDFAACKNATGCSWCTATASCLHRKSDCPSSCFLYRSESACGSPIAQVDQCEWCPSTATCLDRYQDPLTNQWTSSCPRGCSLTPGVHFSCGSAILLVLILALMGVMVLGFRLVIYYVQRDDEFSTRLKRYARRMHPSGWLLQRERRRSEYNNSTGDNTLAEEHSPLLESFPSSSSSLPRITEQ